MAFKTPRPRHKGASHHRTRGRDSPAPNRPKSRKPERGTSRSAGSTHPKARYEYYIALAQAAVTSGDAIESEHYYQHADHYFRLMNETPA